jgi:transposase
MNQIDQIKELQRQGLGSQEIAGRLKIDRKTVAKYMREEDFNGKAQEKRAPASKLDPWKPIIDGWLEEDQRMRFKQRHRPNASTIGFRPNTRRITAALIRWSSGI